ncbi:response regulator [bacterium]|nr:response regulator [bacterium]
MPIITLFSGSWCHADQIADRVAGELGMERIDEKLLPMTSERFNIPVDKLRRTLYGPPPFFDSFTQERQRNRIYLTNCLAELLLEDGKLYHGMAALLAPKIIRHLLRVCVIGKVDTRIANAEEAGLSRKEAQRSIHREDRERTDWARFLHDKEPWSKALYDIVLPIEEFSIDQAADLICENARKPAVEVSEMSLQAAKDFLLATEVHLALLEHGGNIEVTSEDGQVTIHINKYTSRLDSLSSELETNAEAVSGVLNAKAVPGTGFVPPSMLRTPEISIPSKVLLVDDEREFVHTLSERLETRNVESAIVYDGEEALTFIEREEPEVMVLDLKMPGIDGIEVLRRVKQDHPNVEVIILTGHGSDREEMLANELGAFAYLRKPVDIDLLAKTMKKAYERIQQSSGEATQDANGERS